MSKVTSNVFATKEDISTILDEIIEFIGSTLTTTKKETINEIRGDFNSLRQELKGDISGLREELKGDISGLNDGFDELVAEVRVLTKEVSSVLKNHEKRLARLETSNAPVI